jgi:hypothetical protein
MKYLGIFKAGTYSGKKYLTVLHHTEQRGNRTVEYYDVWETSNDFEFDKPKDGLDKNFIRRASGSIGMTPTGKKKK